MKKYILLSLSFISVFAQAVVTSSAIDTTMCKDSTIVLRSSYSGAEQYKWYSNTAVSSTTDSYSFTPTAEGEYTFGVHAYKTQIDTAKNLMKNGSFEEKYQYFDNDFYAPTYKSNGQKVFDPDDAYNNSNYTMKDVGGKNYGHHYAVSTDASRFWPGDGVKNGYYPIKAQDGNNFLVVDASDEGYAWRSRQEDNPDLIIESGKSYLFSCWVAFPNRSDQFEDPISELQFFIGYRDGAAVDHMQAMGQSFKALPLAPGQKPGDLTETERYKWRQHAFTWTADFTSSTNKETVIGVKNITKPVQGKEGSGNDFCLDNIVFQLVDSTIIEVASDSFIVNVNNCSCIPVYSMWNDVLFVDNYGSLYTGYQWYCNGKAISGATMQYYRLSSAGNNDTYKCVMQDANGLSYETCESKFAEAKVSSNYPEGDHGSKAPVARRIRYRFGQLMVEEITCEDGSVEYRKIIH